MHNLTVSFYWGVFLLSICMLSGQIVLTRLLSVVFWCHFVFLIISAVMFGLTAGTLLTYFNPRHFHPDKTSAHITRYSIFSASTLCVSFLSLFFFPGVMVTLWGLDSKSIGYCYVPILVVPFVCLGVTFSLILTRFPQDIGRIYGVNFLGSAAGCIAAYFLLNTFDGAVVIFMLTALCFGAAICFAFNHEKKPRGLIWFLRLAIVCLIAAGLYSQGVNTIEMTWRKGELIDKRIFSKWNFFSFVSLGKPTTKPFGWGYSPKVVDVPIRTTEYMIAIDEGAGTVLTTFKDIKDLDYLTMDISSLAYYIRKPDVALVIGSGGGRDLLAAVISGAQKVVGVEINGDIINLAYHSLRGVKGTITQFPQIKVYNDDGRSFIARSNEKFDLIQASLVDSFAAASSGAFALMENSLYTKEAWVTYLEHLTPRGVLTFSRWHHKDALEIYRLLTITKSALRDLGIRNYRDHILLTKVKGPKNWYNVGTIIVSRTAFSDEEIKRLYQVCERFQFEVTLTKDFSSDPIFDEIFEHDGDRYDFESIQGNIDPTTDNKPFYFYFSDFGTFVKNISADEGPKILRQTTFLVLVLGVVFLLVPFLFAPQRRGFDDIQFSPTVYFSCIGLAFMFIEIPLIQRLGIFLGHPVYGLTVVLFSLLLSCGLGSMYSKRISSVVEFRKLTNILLGIILLLAFVLPQVIQNLMAVPIAVKIFVSVICTSAAGFLMGIPFPFGVSQVSTGPRVPLVFYWAVNGFTSMCASAFAMVILIHLGYPWAIMLGLVFYALAFVSIPKFAKSNF